MSLEGKHVFAGVLVGRVNAIKDVIGADGYTDMYPRLVERGYTAPQDIDSVPLTKKFPITDFIAICSLFEEEHGADAFARLTRRAARKKGVVGFFLSWRGTPDFLCRKIPEIYSKYYDFGELEGEMEGEKAMIIRGKGMHTIPLLCRSYSHYYEGILKNIKVEGALAEHVKCEGEGDDHCEWRVTWE